jgi:hypothetical protein
MLFPGIDSETPSIKVSVVDADTKQCICSVQYLETEIPLIARKTGWTNNRRMNGGKMCRRSYAKRMP